MKLIGKYLKPFALVVAVCVVFLFIQAMCELELPNQMSNLVNTGIQAGGIEDGAPEAVSEDAMGLLTLFMDSDGAETMASSYTRTEPGAPEAEDYLDTYPALADAPGYVLTETDSGALEETDLVYNSAVYAMTLLFQDQMGDTGEDVEDEETTGILDLSPLYAMAPQLETMREAGLLQDYMDLASGDDTLTAGQIAVGFTGLFYAELGADLDSIQSSYIWRTGFQMLGISLVCVAAAVTVGWFASRVATSVAKKLRHDVFEKVSGFAGAEYDKFSTASLITRSTNDIQQIQQVVLIGIRMVFYAPILATGGIIMALRTSLSLSWIIVVAVAALIGLVIVLLAIAMPKFTLLQKLIDRVNLVSREGLSGMMVIRAFGNEPHESERFSEANGDLRDTNRFVQRTMAFMMPAMMLIMNLTTVLIVWVGARAIENSVLQIGSMMAFMQYIMQIIMSFLMIAMVFIMVPRALVSARRIQEVLDTEPTINDPSAPQPLTSCRGEVAFENVSFRYEGAESDALSDISFTAKPGETTAIIGATGSGKSTLVNLIPRFYDVTDGRVTVDGSDVRQVTQQDLRENIGYVPQKGFLFSGNIVSNIHFGKPDAGDAEVQEALDIAQADFVAELENGVYSPISQGGTNVSGGQRQRLAIARALVKKPPIYIFDDSFSALDMKTDAALRRALAEKTGDATVIIVAQRVSSIMEADQILVLDHGRIVGKGTHQELLYSCDEYREIAMSQMSKEELA